MGIYDSGSNVSLINSKLLHIKNNTDNNQENLNVRTINGVKRTLGIISLNIKIFDIEETANIFVIDKENFDYDFLIGLDCIKTFRLTQNENLEIIQKKMNLIERNTNESEMTTINKEIIPDVSGKFFKEDTHLTSIYNTASNDNNINNCMINFNEHINFEDFSITINVLDFQKQAKIEQLIKKYKSIFAKDKYDIGAVKDYEARIDLTIDKYCAKRPYRCTITDKKEIEEQISKLLKKNLIEESYSPFAAPVTLAFKKEDGKKSRLCIDFRDLNKIVVPQSQPFPLIEDLMVKTRNCKIFSTLDINSAFWSIPLRIEDKLKTAFVTQEGHFQWTCLPFGLKTAPAIFQRILSSIIRKHNLSNFAVNYIDDILVFSKTFEEHIEHLSQLLNSIQKEGFRLKLSKCNFASDSVKYLGHIIKNNSITPLQDNLVAIKNFPTPKSQKNVRQFLGKINFYNKYIPNFSIKLEPLYNLLRKGQKFIWSEKCQETFDEMKKMLCSQPVLTIFDPDLPIHIYTDASIEGIGAIFKQVQLNGEEKPVAYFSRKLNENQKRKKAIYLECLAIKESVKYWQHWLIGRYFTVYSDHKPLERMNIKARTDEDLGNLTYYLSQYDFKIIYSPGKYNTEADCLSRNPVLEPNNDEDEHIKIVNLIKLNDILKDQEKNEDIPNIKDKLKFKDGIYYRVIKGKEKILLTQEFSKKLIEYVHQYYCHIGRKQMENKIKPFYMAKKLCQNIKEICERCEVCLKNKSRGSYRLGLMSHLGPATYPFEIMSVDTIGGFGGSRSTKKYLHLLVDHFTRYAYILTSKTQNSYDFIKLLKNVSDHNKIGMILADQYPSINSKEFKTFLDKEDIKIIFTAANTPFSNGLNERLNQTLVNKIRCKINEKGNKLAWTTIAHECVQKYNETEHTITGYSPKYLLEGKNIDILPYEIKRKNSRGELFEDRKVALENTLKSHNYNKKLYDRKRKHLDFKVGDTVYVENGNKLNRKKLDELRVGPYKILEKISNSIYKVDTGHKKIESNLFHISKLIPKCDFKTNVVSD